MVEGSMVTDFQYHTVQYVVVLINTCPHCNTRTTIRSESFSQIHGFLLFARVLHLLQYDEFGAGPQSGPTTLPAVRQTGMQVFDGQTLDVDQRRRITSL